MVYLILNKMNGLVTTGEMGLLPEQTLIRVESIRIGNLTVHLFPYDHIDTTGKSLPQAVKAYTELVRKIGEDGVFPMIEYFLPEVYDVGNGTGKVPSAPGLPSQGSELEQVIYNYGQFVELIGVKTMLVADPAYNIDLAAIEGYPQLLGVIGTLTASLSLKRFVERVRLGNLSRREFLQLSSLAFAGLLGSITGVNELLQLSTGESNFNPPDLPGEIISERDMRMLTVAYAIKDIATRPGVRATDLILIYPPSEIARIKSILNGNDPVSGAQLDMYELLYGYFGIMKIREWKRQEDGVWRRTASFPINPVSPFTNS